MTAKLLAIGLLALIGIGPLVLAAEPARFSIAIEGRKVDPSRRTIRVTHGQTLELAFTADETIELHLHGYDQSVTVQPDAVAVLRLEAKFAGRFPIEAHGFGGRPSWRHVVLLYLEVHPR